MTSTGNSSLKLILGAANVGDKEADPWARYDTPDEVNAFINVFARRGYTQLDTAAVYSPQAPYSSEPRLGAANAGERFSIDTKADFMKGHTKENIAHDIDNSLKLLKISQINVYYLHIPDRSNPVEPAIEALNEAYQNGKIKAWGISNFRADEVQQVIDICEKRGFVKPAVYQGHYNALVRAGEKELFPILRKNGKAFYAYSPAAGGLFSGSHKNPAPNGRFDPAHKSGSITNSLYVKPSVLGAVDKAIEVFAKHNIGGHAAALRWTAHHSILDKEHGDGLIIGASSSQQLESNVDTIEEGPLPEEVAAALNAVYQEAGDEVSYHMYMQFITVTNPGQRGSAKTTRKAHSHAARVAHARTRTQRVVDYQDQKRRQEAESHDEPNSLTAERRLPQNIDLQKLTSVPFTLPGDFQPTNIVYFIKSLSNFEHSIFSQYIAEKAAEIRGNWIFFVSNDPVLLRGCLLAACRYLAQVELRDDYTLLAIQYKQYYLQSLRKALSSRGLSSRRNAVAMTTVLALDEITCGDHLIAAKHVLGAMKMIEEAGGLDILGLNHLVRYVLYNLMFGKRLSEWDIDLHLASTLMTPDSILP
ncbi:Aflatoxin B1 aldehyde reductase member 3 [Fusarium sp. NRRL 52700]|nr:Aflatoxin B1 aldehyde reductase member 3 [Fusarium sp. NRRL 52700]